MRSWAFVFHMEVMNQKIVVAGIDHWFPVLKKSIITSLEIDVSRVCNIYECAVNSVIILGLLCKFILTFPVNLEFHECIMSEKAL